MTEKGDREYLKKKIRDLEKKVSKQKSIEQQLHDTNSILNNILSTSPVGIGLADNRVLKWANEAMLKMFGFDDVGEYIGKSARILFPSDKEFEHVGKVLYDALKTGKSAQIDTTFKRKDGSTFYANMTINCPDPSHPMQGNIVIVSDISWRKRAEERRIEKEKLMGVIEMAGAVCHEMNQPLQAAVFECADALEEDPENQTIAKVKCHLDDIGKITRKLMGITRYETRDYIQGQKIIDIEKASAEDANGE